MKKTALLDKFLMYYYILLFFIYIPTNGEGASWIPKPLGYYVAMSLPVLFILILILKKEVSYYKEMVSSLMILFVLFIYCSLTSFWSSDTFSTLWRSCQTFIPVLILGLLIMNVKDSKKFFIGLLKINVLVSMFLSVIAILVKTFGYTYWLKNEITVNTLSVAGFTINQYLYKFSTYYRYSSITGNPNLFGWILFLGMASLVILYFSKNIKKWRFTIILLIQFYCLSLSFSRTCILISFIFLTLFYLVKVKGSFFGRKNITKNIAIGSIFIAVISLFFLFSSSDTTISLSGRNEIWGMLLNEFSSNPFGGMGFNTTQEILIDFGVNEEAISGGAHSFYIGFLTETGMIGMLIFISFVIYTLSIIIKQRRGFSIVYNNKVISIGAVCLLVSLLIHQSSEFLLLRNNYFNYIWFIMLFTTLKFHFDNNKKAHE